MFNVGKKPLRVYVARDKKGGLFLFRGSKKPTKQKDDNGQLYWDGKLIGTIKKDDPYFADVLHYDANATLLELRAINPDEVEE